MLDGSVQDCSPLDIALRVLEYNGSAKLPAISRLLHLKLEPQPNELNTLRG